jgi:microcystin-dependent protein
MANDMADAIDAFVVSVPCGGVICWATTIIPEGWMLCDGRELSRTLYPDLFAIIGVQYGCGDGDTTFNIPKYQVQSIPIASNEVPGFTLATRCHIIRVKA